MIPTVNRALLCTVLMIQTAIVPACSGVRVARAPAGLPVSNLSPSELVELLVSAFQSLGNSGWRTFDINSGSELGTDASVEHIQPVDDQASNIVVVKEKARILFQILSFPPDKEGGDYRMTFATYALKKGPDLSHMSEYDLQLSTRSPNMIEQIELSKFSAGAKAIEATFLKSGFKPDSRFFSGFGLGKSAERLLFNGVRMAMWNAFWIHFLGFPRTIPKNRIFELLAITNRLAREHGIYQPAQLKTLSPELSKKIFTQYALEGNLEQGIDAARVMFMAAVAGVGVLFALEPRVRKNFKTLNKSFEAATRSKEFDCNAARAVHWRAFREGFHDLRGRYPDAKAHPEDAETLESNRSRIDGSC